MDDGPDDPVQAAAQGWVSLTVDLHGVADKTGVLDRFAAAGHFPDWWGANWDALQDVLSDLSWLGPADGYLVLLDGWGELATAAPEVASVVESVLAEAARSWTAAGTPFRSRPR